MTESNVLTFTFHQKYYRHAYRSIMIAVRGSPHKRGHQYHVRFSGGRCSNVNAEHVLAALRAGDRMSIIQTKHQSPCVTTDQTAEAPVTNAMFFAAQSQEQNVAIPNELVQVVETTNENVS